MIPHKDMLKYLRGFRYQQTVKEIKRLTQLAEELRAELIENHQDPKKVLATDYVHGERVALLCKP